jgi:hypothetical protein
MLHHFVFTVLERAPDGTDLGILEKQWADKYPAKILYNTKPHYQSSGKRIVKWMPKARAIKIKKSTYDDLVSFSSNMTETFADVVDRIIDYYKKGHPKR